MVTNGVNYDISLTPRHVAKMGMTAKKVLVNEKHGIYVQRSITHDRFEACRYFSLLNESSTQQLPAGMHSMLNAAVLR